VSGSICSSSTIHAREQIFSFPRFPFFRVSLLGVMDMLGTMHAHPETAKLYSICRYALAFRSGPFRNACQVLSPRIRFESVSHRFATAREVYC
jgi:hypothetical protein